MTLADPAPWLLLVAAAHLGFQLTVDLVVYPALVDVPADRWTAAHERHSRRVVPLVVLLYPPLVAVLAWTVAARPSASGTWLALVGGALAVLTTAAVAAPLHGRLSSAREVERRDLLTVLLLADRVRTAGALVCAVGAGLLMV